MEKYNPQKLEKKWQKYWEDNKTNYCDLDGKKPKFYNLAMFYYPSGAKIHIGHGYNYSGSDVFGRYKRLNGFNVLEPMGADAFGLPAENYAIKTSVHPSKTTKDNIDFGRGQLKELGLMYDWTKEINTSSPDYYKWTQWLFTVLYKAGLAYRATSPVNWCPSCKTVLANEQVIAGKCERCETQVIQKNLKQWFFKITKYADKLLQDHDKLNWPEKTILMQKNWIGRSEGAEVDFEIPLLKASEMINPVKASEAINPRINPRIYSGAWGDSGGDTPSAVRRPINWSAGEGSGTTQDPPINWGVNTDEEVYFVTFPTYKREPFFQDETQAKNILKLFYEVIKDKNFNIPDLVVMPEHIHFPVKKKAADDLKKIVKNIKGVVSRRFGHNQQHLWAKGFEYEKIKDEKSYQNFINYLKNNPQKRGLKPGNRLFSSLNAWIRVFTTRPDTLFGATFMVLSPEHELVKRLKPQIKNWSQVEKYIKNSQNKTDIERTDVSKEKTGVELKGVTATNPVNQEKIPIFIADYVLSTYGTGAIMAVPAHDERDFEFAKKYNIPIREVIMPAFGERHKKAEPRKTISAVIQRKSDGKFLFLKWKGYDWVGPVVGGIEGNESIKEAAEREVFEEAGYKAKAIKKLAGEVEANFFADHKNVWRHRIDQAVLLELIDEKQYEIDKEEEERHEEIWLDAEEALKQITHENNKIGLLYFLGKEYYTGEGIAINSGKFNGLPTEKFKIEITKWLASKNLGQKAVNYRLRDWLISRQRYWGAPIPIIDCDKCGEVLVQEKDLPVKLPDLKDFKPTAQGDSPLARSKEFLNVKCPKCKGPAKRSTETMDTFVCSSWYFLRFISPKLKDKPFDKKIADKWLPVDQYCGGAEHATLHLLYARFITKVLKDQGYINFDEPFTKLNHQGMILAEDGAKMSKSKGNVVIPEDYIKKYGADVFRAYVLFLAPFEDGGAWSDKGIMGVKRFIDKVWDYFNTYKEVIKKVEPGHQFEGDESLPLLHRTIKKVGGDIEQFKFNTAISQLMILFNELPGGKKKEVLREESFTYDRQTGMGGKTIGYNFFDNIKDMESILIILAPFMPHIAEELWQDKELWPKSEHKDSIFKEDWPDYKKELIKEKEIQLVIQINGKVRDKIQVSANITEPTAKKKALGSEKVKKWVKGTPKKVIFVKGKLINIVV